MRTARNTTSSTLALTMLRVEIRAAGILRSLVWAPTTEYQLDTEVGDAIASYCAEAGIECPPDEAFQVAEWAVPVGTELEDPEWLEFARSRKAAAPSLRVTLGGAVFVLLVGWPDRCGCGTCKGLPSLRVVEVSR